MRALVTETNDAGLIVIELMQAVDRLVAERDEARAERDDLRGLNAVAERMRLDAVTKNARLRAAVPDLPDVGPVERVALGIRQSMRCEVNVLADPTLAAFAWPVSVIPYAAAAALKMLAELDREAEERAAADTTTDEFPDETLFTGHLRCKGRYGPDGLRCGGGLGHASYSACGPGIALDDFYAAHRARTHGEDA